MTKNYNLKIRRITALPRSLRLRRGAVVAVTGGGVSLSYGGIGGSAGEGSAGAPTCDGHTHDNKPDLDALHVTDDGYIKVDHYAEEGGDGDLQYVTGKAKAGYADMAAELTEDSPTNKRFIRRDTDDTAEGNYTFEKNINVKGRATFDKQATSAVGFGTDDYVPDASGARIWTDKATGISYAEADVLKARRKIAADSIEVREISHVGGVNMLSPASARFTRVVPLYQNEGDSVPRVYRCFFRARNGEGLEVANDFKVYDLVRSQTFNLAGGNNVVQRYYWRQCSAVGTSADGTEHFIELANWAGAMDAVSLSAPAAGDSAVVCGNTNAPERQNVIMLAATGTGSPYIYQFRGIDSFELPVSKLVTRISPDGNKFTGSFIIEDAGEFQGKNVVAALGIKADAIELKIKNELGVTGIDIADGTITLTAESTMFKNADGTTSAMFDGGKLLAKFIDVDTLTVRRLFAGSATGRHVEIDPATAQVRITDDGGTERVRLEGARYNSPHAIFGTASGVVALTSPNGTAAAGAEGTTWTNFRILGDFITAAPMQAQLTGGAVTLSAYAPSGASGSGVQQQPHATISFGIELRVYADAAHTDALSTITLATGTLTATAGQTVKRTFPLYGAVGYLAAAGHCRLCITFGGGTAGTGAYARAAWGANSEAAEAVALTTHTDAYRARYFSNGFCLGSRTDNYVMAYRNASDVVCVEARNGAGGIRLGANGVEIMHHGGTWCAPPLFLFAALIDGDRMTGARSFDGNIPAFTHTGAGTFRLEWPAQWRAKIYIDAGNAFAHINVTTAAATATARVGVDGVDITTTVGGTIADAPFRIILQSY